MNNIKILPSLLIFAEVAKQHSFTQAAKKFGMSKSAVSQHIKRLEEHIGLQLLSRHTRGMSLTSVGEKLLQRSELLNDQVNLAFEELSSSKETPSGVFAITIPHSYEKNIVTPALIQLCKEFPLIEPNILVTDEPKDLIQNNLDVAFYFGELKDNNYRALPVGMVEEVVCASPAFIKKNGPLKNFEDLHGQRFIATAWQNEVVEVFHNSEQAEKVILDVKVFARTNTLPSVLEMARNGMGVALLPEFVLKSSLANGQLLRILPDYRGRQWPCYLVHRFQRDKPIHITRFYQLVKHFFAKESTL